MSKDKLLQDLHEMRAQADGGDFCHSQSEATDVLARRIVEGTYHRDDDFPAPALAPDGDGGLVMEWKRGKAVVRLVVQGERAYIYSAGLVTVDKPATGTALAQRLRSLFHS